MSKDASVTIFKKIYFLNSQSNNQKGFRHRSALGLFILDKFSMSLIHLEVGQCHHNVSVVAMEDDLVP